MIQRISYLLATIRNRVVAGYFAAFHNTPRAYSIKSNEKVGEYKLVMRLSDGPGMRQRLGRGTEHAERELVQPLIKQGDVCVDVGAHVGDWLIEMAMLTGGNGRVVGFEAIPHYYELTKASIASNRLQNAEVKLAAVGAGTGSIQVPTEMLTGNLVERGRIAASGTSEDGKVRTTEVPLVALDDQIARFDFAKIDCEGFELKVLKGMSRLLAQPTQFIVFLEVHKRQLGQIEGEGGLRQLGRLLLEEHRLVVRQCSSKHCVCSKVEVPGLKSGTKMEGIDAFVRAFDST